MAFARWFFVGVFAVVSMYLLAISLLTVGLSIPFALGFGWVAWRLARWRESDPQPRSLFWLPVALGVPAGVAAMLVVLG